MSVWLVLRNIGTILSLLKSLENLVSTVATKKEAPSRETIKAVLDQVEALLDSGAIDVPGVDEKEISRALQQIEDFMMAGSTQKAA